MNTDKQPLMLPCLGFIVGIGVQTLFPFKYDSLPWIALGIIALLNLVFDNFLPLMYHKLLRQTLLLLGLFFFLGVLRVQYEAIIASTMVENANQMTVRGTILDIAKTANSGKLILSIDTMSIGDKVYSTSEKAIIYFPDSIHDLKVFHRFTGTISLFSNALSNPLAFDQKAHLQSRGLSFAAYLMGPYLTSDYEALVPMKFYPQYIRHKLMDKLHQVMGDSRAFGLIGAMLLGERDELDKHTQEVFSNTGAIHVLAVSGLHVGIIASMVFWMFSLLRMRRGLIFSIGLVTFTYAMLTGASPSVIRAGILIFLFVVGRSKNHYLNGINLLSFVAIVMLVLRPADLFSISFQFSFVAVLSLMVFGKPFGDLWKPQNKYVKWFWLLFSASLAVQLLMTPLIIYYFARFPVYFFLSCFIAIPMAYLAVAGGILGLGLAFIVPPIAQQFFNIFSPILNGFYELLEMLNRLPFAVIENIFISLTGMFCLCFAILFLKAYFTHRKNTYLLLANVAFVLLIYDEINHYASINKSDEIVAYSMKSGFLVDVFIGNNIYEIRSPGLDEASIAFASHKYRLVKRAQVVISKVLETGNPACFDVDNIQICFSGEKSYDSAINPDILFVYSNFEPDMSLQNKPYVVVLNKTSYKVKNKIVSQLPEDRYFMMDKSGYFRYIIKEHKEEQKIHR